MDDASDNQDYEDLKNRLDSMESKYMELLKDVRSRVIQVKRETDQKLEADAIEADFTELETNVETNSSNITELRSTLEEIDEQLTTIENTLEQREEAIEDLEILEERAAQLASIVLKTRDRVDNIEDILGIDESLDIDMAHLRYQIHKKGVTSGRCQSCKEPITLTVLNAPICPHCGDILTGVTSGGFFSSNTIHTQPRDSPEED